MTEVGRYLESLSLVNQVLEIDPDHGMAYSVRLSILQRFAEDVYFFGERLQSKNKKSTAAGIFQYVYHNYKLLLKDKNKIESIIKNGMPGALEDIKEKIKYIEKNLHSTLKNKKYLPEKVKKSDNEKIDSFVEFMKNYDLFLTYNIRDTEDAFGYDNYLTPNAVFPIEFKDGGFISQLNEIKESYIYICKTIFDYLEKDDKQEDFYNYLDESASYSDYLKGFQNGIKIHFIKTAIKSSYDIFDKIMVVLNTFHKTNEEETNISW